MQKIKLRKSRAAAALLVCAVSAAAAVWGEDGDELANSINARLRQHQSAATQPAAADESHLASFTRYLFKTDYYPVNEHDLQAAAAATIDAADPGAGATATVQAVMAAMIDALGHGAHVLTTLGGDSSGDKKAATRQVGSTLIVSLPTMNVGDPNKARTCADLLRFLDTQDADSVGSMVLDLRGNEGGSMNDSSCLAGAFVKSGKTLFLTVNKQGAVVKYESESSGHKPIKLPVAVLIDSHTDSGGLLVAAALQAQSRAAVIGEQKSVVNDAVASLVFPPGAGRGAVLPTGQMLLPDKRPLATGLRVDIRAAANDDDAAIDAARAYLAQQHR